ncbi:hypothetical protein ACS0TY_016543 [Phlomoides rotata]
METYEVSQQSQYSSTISYQYVDRVEENVCRCDESDEESKHILRELLKEIDHKCKKLVSRVEKDVSKRVHDLSGKSGSDILEKIVRKLNKGDREEEGDFIIRERGADGDILQEIKIKVGRFKVKTMNTVGVGVVKEEGK